MGAGRPGGRAGGPALCVETGGGRGEGSGPRRPPRGLSPASLSPSAAQVAWWRRGAAGETSGGEPARRSRGLGFKASGGMAGLGGSGWEEAVGEGRGRPGTSGRASRRAAATLTLIRCRVTKWRIGPQWPPPDPATGKEREIGREREREEAAWQQMPQMAPQLGRSAFPERRLARF